MSLTTALFYLLAAVIVAATAMGITRRSPVHAVVYLVVSFFATAVLFALLGAPLVAVLQVIIPAGAVMILFLFILMLLGSEEPDRAGRAFRKWALPGVLAVAVTGAGTALLLSLKGPSSPLFMASSTARLLGTYIYSAYWPAVEAVSVLFFVALAGAMFLVRDFTPLAGTRDDKGGQRP